MIFKNKKPNGQNDILKQSKKTISRYDIINSLEFLRLLLHCYFFWNTLICLRLRMRYIFQLYDCEHLRQWACFDQCKTYLVFIIIFKAFSIASDFSNFHREINRLR